jgi:Kdo2-lipid IVA lauroyltransferase/acyltransferase
MRHKLAFRLEAAAVRTALALLRALPIVTASNLGGAIARGIGPLLPVSRVAHANLRLALPELDAAARRRIVRGVWDNLGRTVAELPHLARLGRTPSGPGWEIAGEDIARRIAAAGGPALFFSGHLANWEMMAVVPGAFGIPLSVFYRAASNPLVDAIIVELRHRALGVAVPMFAKGALGARGAMAHLKAGGYLGMLIDQKMNDGIAAPLFGHPAMTAPAAAAFALRYRCPLIPVRVERLGPARFRLHVEPPLPQPDTGDRHADIAALTAAMNACLERWVRARPDNWLWLHRRWPKEFYP